MKERIESLNFIYRRLNRQRNVFPSDTALLKVLYLATFEATKRWSSTSRNWGQAYGAEYYVRKPAFGISSKRSM